MTDLMSDKQQQYNLSDSDKSLQIINIDQIKKC